MRINKKKIAKLGIDLPPPQVELIPPPPYVVRGDPPHGSINVLPNGLVALSLWAEAGNTQEKCASLLSISLRSFQNLLGSADSSEPVRLAFEAGQASHKSNLIVWLTEAARSGNVIASFFLLKAVHLLRDQGPAVEVNVGNKIQFVLPGNQPKEDWYKSLGIEGPIDTRQPANRIAHDIALGRVDDRREVTPRPALPAPPHILNPTEIENERLAKVHQRLVETGDVLPTQPNNSRGNVYR
jgi:hypothetical protein